MTVARSFEELPTELRTSARKLAKGLNRNVAEFTYVTGGRFGSTWASLPGNDTKWLVEEAATAAYRTWVQRIESGVFSKGQCNQFAQAVVRIAQGQWPGGKRTNLTQAEARALVGALTARPVRLTDEHTQQGLRWIKRYAAKTYNIGQVEVDRVLAHFSHFEYHGRAVVPGYPVWHIILTTGEEIAYWNSAWQTAAYDNAAPPGWAYVRGKQHATPVADVLP